MCINEIWVDVEDVEGWLRRVFVSLPLVYDNVY